MAKKASEDHSAELDALRENIGPHLEVVADRINEAGGLEVKVAPHNSEIHLRPTDENLETLEWTAASEFPAKKKSKADAKPE